MPGSREPDDGTAVFGWLNTVSVPAPPARRRQSAPLWGLVLEDFLAKVDQDDLIAYPLVSLPLSWSLLWPVRDRRHPAASARQEFKQIDRVKSQQGNLKRPSYRFRQFMDVLSTWR